MRVCSELLGITGMEQNRVGQFPGRSVAARRNRRCHTVRRLFEGFPIGSPHLPGDATDAISEYMFRHNIVEPHLLGSFPGQHFSHPDERRPKRVGQRYPVDRLFPRQRCQINDRASTAFPHDRNCGAAEPQGAHEDGLEGIVPLVIPKFQDGSSVRAGRVVDEDVKAAQRVHRKIRSQLAAVDRLSTSERAVPET